MEAQMMNIPSSPGAGSAAGTKAASTPSSQALSASGGATDFSAELVQIMGKDHDTDATAAESENSGLMMLLSAMNPVMLLNMMPQAQQTSFEEVAQKVIEIMNQDPTVLQNSILSNPMFQDWMVRAGQVLSNMQSGLGNGKETVKGVVSSTPISAIPGNDAYAPTADQVVKMLASFLAVSQHNPNDKSLMQLEQSFQSLFQPLANTMDQDSTNVVQQSLTKSSTGETARIDIHNTPAVSAQKHAARLHSVLGYNAEGLQNDESSPDKTSLVQTLQGLIKPVAVQHPKMMAVQPIIQSENSNAAVDEQLVSTSDTNVIVTQQDFLRSISNSIPKTVPHTVSVPNFAQDMTNFMMKNLKISQFDGISEAKISLTPEHLGQVDVKITMHNGQMVAQFMTETALGKEAIENQMFQLRGALQSQGIQVDKLEVSQSSLQSSLFQGQRHHQSSQQFGRQSKGRNLYVDEAAGTSEFERIAMNAYAMYGGSFNVTA